MKYRYERRLKENERGIKDFRDSSAYLVHDLIMSQIGVYVSTRKNEGYDILVSEPVHSSVINNHTKKVEVYVSVTICSAEKSLPALVREIYVSIYPYEQKVSLNIDGELILKEVPMNGSMEEFFDCIKNRVASMGSVSVKAST